MFCVSPLVTTHRSLGILDHPKVFCEHNITISDRVIMEFRDFPGYYDIHYDYTTSGYLYVHLRLTLSFSVQKALAECHTFLFTFLLIIFLAF